MEDKLCDAIFEVLTEDCAMQDVVELADRLGGDFMGQIDQLPMPVDMGNEKELDAILVAASSHIQQWILDIALRQGEFTRISLARLWNITDEYENGDQLVLDLLDSSVSEAQDLKDLCVVARCDGMCHEREED